MQPRPAGGGYARGMSNPAKNLPPYRCQFVQLGDGSWLAEDWHVIGLAATGRTREECSERIQKLILEDARGELGDEAGKLALSVCETAKPRNLVEYRVTGMPMRPISKTTNA